MISANKLACVAAIVAMGLFTHMARGATEVTPATASRLIEHASYQSSASATPALTQIVQALTAQRGGVGDAAKYVDYYLGYANYALAQDYVGRDNHKAGDYLDKADAAL